MKRLKQVLCLFLCIAMLAGLCACGTPQEEAPSLSPDTSPAGDSPSVPASGGTYADAYVEYWSFCGAIWDEVTRRLEAHNAALALDDPQEYFMDPTYLMLVYAPFNTACPAVGGAITGDDLATAQEVVRLYWPDAVLTSPSQGAVQAEYTFTDKTSGTEVLRQGLCLWEFDAASGSFRVTGYADGELTEFTEFIPQGENSYLLYTMGDKALVTFEDGAITQLYHAHMINEPPLGSFAGDVRLNSLEEDDFFPGKAADPQWITQDENAQYVITIQDGVMTYSGKIPQDIPGEDGQSRVGVTWVQGESFSLKG